VGVLAVLAGIAACGGSTRQVLTTATRAATPPLTATIQPPPSPPKPKPKPKPKPAPNPGTLPQTTQLPSASTRRFHSEMNALWAGVVADRLGRAMPAFFPEAAYVQVKAIGDPQGDWVERLVGDFRLDIDAAHALLAGHAAQLVRVQVPRAYAHWVDPGACYNRIGYYEVPNARVVYREGGQIHSFGIASMISWRGVWYVVHLGAVQRSAAAGVLDDPSPGPGTSAPSSTC
jgi:hypothetical protein